MLQETCVGVRVPIELNTAIIRLAASVSGGGGVESCSLKTLKLLRSAGSTCKVFVSRAGPGSVGPFHVDLYDCRDCCSARPKVGEKSGAILEINFSSLL